MIVLLQWKLLEMDPLEWGWKKSDEKFMPFLTDLPPAPNELLKIIRCNNQTDCSNMRCNMQAA